MMHMTLPSTCQCGYSSGPQVITYNGMYQDKTDPFCQGVYIYLGNTDNNICPVTGFTILSIAKKSVGTIIHTP